MNAFASHAGELSLLAGVGDPLPAVPAREDGRRRRRTCGRLHPQRASCIALKELAEQMRLARAPRPDAPQRFARALVRLEQADHADPEAQPTGLTP